MGVAVYLLPPRLGFQLSPLPLEKPSGVVSLVIRGVLFVLAYILFTKWLEDVLVFIIREDLSFQNPFKNDYFYWRSVDKFCDLIFILLAWAITPWVSKKNYN
jgi:hypothetical protein